MVVTKLQNTRTDLAMESMPDQTRPPEGVRCRESDDRGFRISDLRIETQSASDILCKPIGRYITVETERFFRRDENSFADGAEILAARIRELLPLSKGAGVLVAGLGNRAITPDAIGPEAVGMTLVTRHLIEQLPESFGSFRPVCAFETGVLGTTGIESAALIRSLFSAARPDAIVAVDALAARSRDKLCRTVQLTDSGIVPGSGVGNARQELSARVFGVPVLAVGVPTVVDAGDGLIVTRRDIDKCVKDVGRLVGYALNLALQEGLTLADVDMLIG